jgi:hypothetical protein
MTVSGRTVCSRHAMKSSIIMRVGCVRVMSDMLQMSAKSTQRMSE